MRIRRLRLTLLVAFTLAATGAISAAPVEAMPHPVKVSGHGAMSPQQIFDLDGGHLSPPGDADMWYDAPNIVNRYLDSINGSTNKKMGTTKPNYATCSTATLGNHHTRVGQVPTGTYLCWKTSAHRFARVLITVNTPSEVDFSYTTWTY